MVIQRRVLGTNTFLGQLYNAQDDSFLALSLWASSEDISSSYIKSSNDTVGPQWMITESDGMLEKTSLFGLSPELTASLLTGMIPNKGSASYLTRAKPSRPTIEASAIYTIITRNEELDLDNPDLPDALPNGLMDAADATHIICGVRFGLTTVFTARTKASVVVSAQDMKRALDSLNPNGSNSHSLSEDIKISAAKLEFDILSDQPRLNAKGVEYNTAFAATRKVIDEIKKINRGKGYPVFCEIKPVAEVAQRLKLHADPRSLVSVNGDYLARITTLMIKIPDSVPMWNDYLTDVQNHKSCVPERQVDGAKKQVNDMKSFVVQSKSILSTTLKDVRTGSEPPTELERVLSSVEADWNSKFNRDKPRSVIKQYIDKMAFYDMLNLEQVRYKADDYDGLEIDIADNITKDYRDKSVYILYFNAQSTSNPLWTETRDEILRLIKTKSSEHEIVLVDCDMGGRRELPDPRIELRRGAEVLIYDVIKDIHALADKGFLHCARTTDIERLGPAEPKPPFASKPIRISCPGQRCNPSLVVEWVCPVCRDTVYFNDQNAYMYCSCGRYHYTNAEYRCKSTTHGEAYTVPSNHLETLTNLKALISYEEHNVLLFGEKGIGKSTFINMFYNFMNFERLEEACAYPGPLRSAIRGEFVTELKDENGRSLRNLTASFGNKSFDEQISTEVRSATRETNIYSFVVNGKVIRLIDTPGIDIGRESNMQNENADKIMKFAQSVHKISAVMFFLSPNDGNLTPMLDFCLTGLLPQIQNNTAKNLIFGFPRSASTNFQLGDTRTPLLRLLRDRNTGVMDLDEWNTFFFEADCFRHLAVFKQERIIMPDREACIRSWNASRDNIRRLTKRILELPM